MTFVVGLTGGIGSGKSAVAEAFAARGVEVTDTDRIAHALTGPNGAGTRAIAAAFGPEALDASGAIDRAGLRRRVFDDPDARARLEAALHPLIRAATSNEVRAWRGPYGILVVPLLLERGGLTRLVQRILVVDCTEEQQVARVVQRSGFPADEVRAIMATQLGRAERLAAADDVIDNSGPPERIGAAVARLDAQYRELAARSNADARPAA